MKCVLADLIVPNSLFTGFSFCNTLNMRDYVIMITIHCDDVITLSHMYTHTHRVTLVSMVMMVHLVIQVEWDLQGKQ